jgi:hypothetical protein|tara:strand:- start:841 stop:1029 length:189 start_codon:yes stop_codon:yes gene_type:complete
MNKAYTDKSWNSLTDLKATIERNNEATKGRKKEIIVSFEGHTLVTNKAEYGLYDGVLSVTDP